MLGHFNYFCLSTNNLSPDKIAIYIPVPAAIFQLKTGIHQCIYSHLSVTNEVTSSTACVQATCARLKGNLRYILTASHTTKHVSLETLDNANLSLVTNIHFKLNTFKVIKTLLFK